MRKYPTLHQKHRGSNNAWRQKQRITTLTLGSFERIFWRKVGNPQEEARTHDTQRRRVQRERVCPG